MFKFSNIVRQNAKTYYDFESNSAKRIWPRYVAICISSIFLSVAFAERSDNFYMGIITVQAILIGFSFNVMVFITSNPIIPEPEKCSLERSEKIQRLNTLSEEIFFNLSYFNVAAILSVVITLILLLLPTVSQHSVEAIYRLSVWIGLDLQTCHSFWEWFFYFAKTLVLTVAYLLIIDSLSTFLRIVGRATFYFEKKIALLQQENV